jgi:hypothetical protein
MGGSYQIIVREAGLNISTVTLALLSGGTMQHERNQSPGVDGADFAKSALYPGGPILFGIIGYVAFRHGRKSSRTELTIAGVALMLFPYVVSETWMLWAVGAGLTAWVFAKWQ